MLTEGMQTRLLFPWPPLVERLRLLRPATYLMVVMLLAPVMHLSCVVAFSLFPFAFIHSHYFTFLPLARYYFGCGYIWFNTLMYSSLVLPFASVKMAFGIRSGPVAFCFCSFF